MGWTTMPRSSMSGHATAKAYLDAQFTYERSQEGGGSRGLKVLASSCPQNRVYYAAAQRSADGVGGDVVAIVCLVRWNPRAPDGDMFGYKSMDETMGPCEASCPEAILTLLTPTDHPHARAWRERCHTNLKRRSRKLAHGNRIRLPEPIRFTDGHVGGEFIVERRGRTIILRDPVRRGGYRLPGLMKRDWIVVPPAGLEPPRAS